MSERPMAIHLQEAWSVVPAGEVRAAAVARHREEVFLATAAGEVLGLADDGSVALRYRSDVGPVSALAVSDDGTAVAGAGPEGIQLWNRYGRCLDLLRLRGVRCLDLRSRDGTLLVATSDRRLLRIRHRSSQTRIEPLAFDPLGVEVGDRGWEGFVVGEWGAMSLYGAKLRLEWRLDLRGPTGPPAADIEGRLLIVPFRELGLCAFEPDGTSLGVYDTPTPPVLAAIAPGGDRLAAADARGGLYLLTRERGFCIWREEGRGPLLGLGLGKDRLFTVDGTGRVRQLLAGEREGAPGNGMGDFLEVRQEARTARREPAWTVHLPPGRGPFLGRIAVSRDGRWLAARIGDSVTVWDGSGRVVQREECDAEVQPVWGAGGRLFLFHPRWVSAWDLPGGRSWIRRGDVRDVSAGDAARSLALLDGAGVVRVLEEGGGEAWARELPEEPLSVHADEGMEAVAACGIEGHLFLLSGKGEGLWRRPLPRSPHVVLAGRRVFIAGAGGEVSCYGYGEERDWRALAPAAVLQLFREGDRAFLATEDNRIYRIEPEGGLTPLDRRADTGRSRLAATASGDWREVSAKGGMLTGYDLEGRLLWTCDAGARVDPLTLTSGEGSLACVAGRRILFLRLDDGPDLPSRYLEI